jgi:hypothetical protein
MCNKNLDTIRNLKLQADCAFHAWLNNKDESLELHYKIQKEIASKDYVAAKEEFNAEREEESEPDYFYI